MSDRGMKKWAPFSSLIEQATCLEKMRYEKNKIEKPDISSDVAEKINYILVNCINEEIEVLFFYNGYIYIVKSTLLKVDKIQKTVELNEGTIPLKDILDINCDKISNKIDDFIS